jgi:PKD repeat protein
MKHKGLTIRLMLALMLVLVLALTGTAGAQEESDTPPSEEPVLAERYVVFVSDLPNSVWGTVAVPPGGKDVDISARDCCIRDDVVEIYVHSSGAICLLATVDSRNGTSGTHPGETHTVSLPEGTYQVQYQNTESSVGPSGWYVDETLKTFTGNFRLPCLNRPPTADPNGPYYGDEGSPVTFDGTGSSDPDGDPLTYDWDFGDGTVVPDAGPTPSHAYGDNGVYDICVTVTDPGGLSDTECASTRPMDVVFALDSSGSMDWNDSGDLRITAAKSFVDKMDSTRDQAGVVSWDHAIDFTYPLSSDFATAKSWIDLVDAVGGTDLEVGLSSAIGLLDSGKQAGASWAIIFLSNGEGSYSGLATADAASKGYVIYSIGLGGAPAVVPLTDMATQTGGQYYASPTADNLQAIFDAIYQELGGKAVIANVDPDVGPITAPTDPVQVNNPINASAHFTDPGWLDTHTAEWDWDVGSVVPVTSTGTVTQGAGDGSVANDHTYSEAGIYTIQLTVTDDDGGAGTAQYRYVVVYDPNAGFVTGGGWIDSLEGAYRPPVYDGSYYELGFADPPVTWDEAEALASAMEIEVCESAHLATVTSQEEQDVISGLMGPTTENGWLGGFQLPSEMSLADNWQWITGEPFVYTNWADGEPNDTPGLPPATPGSEQYLETYQGSGLWNDAPVEDKYYYVIEYEDCYLPTGKATFGFVSKYKKGASEPTGSTEFQFHAGNLNFHSSSYEWLVVTGSDYARFKGVGTINGEGEYKFMLWAGDGDPDTFRIRIWTENELGVETAIYDNDMNQPIAGGSIVIHAKKK